MENLDLQKITRAERLWLWRRGKPTGLGGPRGRNGNRMSIGEAALHLGVSPAAYASAEADEDSEFLKLVWDAALTADPETVGRSPTEAELCALARRRAGAKVGELCAELGGVTKPYFYKLEDDGDPMLIALWQRRGYAFNSVDMASTAEV